MTDAAPATTGPASTEPTTPAQHAPRTPLGRWLFAPVPLGRLAAYRTLVYLFVVYDVAFRSSAALAKADVASSLYRPLRVARLLPFLPEPSHAVVLVTFWGLIVLAPLAAFSRRPRALGVAVFVLYFEWMLIAMSYGKVDHDRLGFLVALALLPTAGRARYGDATATEAAGWAFRMIQLAAIATYFLAAWAKLRFGGVHWLWGSTLAWAIERRGTWFSTWLLGLPLLLRLFQVFMVGFEALSPAIFFVSERTRRRLVVGLYGFHAVTALALTITFAPHLVAMAAFLPVEALTPVRWARGLGQRPDSRLGRALGLGKGAGGGAAGHAVAVAGHPPVDGPGQGEHDAVP